MNCEIKNITIGQGRPKVCVPIVGRNKVDIEKELQDILEASKETNIDIVEFRGDFYEALDDMDSLANVLKLVGEKLKDKVLLFTIRSKAEGGEKLNFTEPTIQQINSFVIENKLADMVDVELFSGETKVKSLVELGKKNGVRIIMSNHDFDKTPNKEEIISRLSRMQSLGADIAKIAVMPQSKEDVLTLLWATNEMKEKCNQTPVVTMSMGSLGALSRVSGEIFGSAITFGTVGKASAPGQIPLKELNEMIRVLGQHCV